MKIAIINRNDLNGGAAVFTYRLMKAFRKTGIDAKMLVVEKTCDDENVVSYADHWKDRYAFYIERLQIYLNNGFSRKNLFKVDTATWGRDITSHPLVQEADVIMLNWINQGGLSLGCIENLCNLGKPIIWTMHDMWECTGICHHAYDCNAYMRKCGNCPYLESKWAKDLSHSIWTQKSRIFAHKNLHFVAVSNWLAIKCKESSLLGGKNITVIPNTTAIDDFSSTRKPNSDFTIPEGHKVLAMGAARLDDPVKGLPILIEAMKFLKKKSPDIATNIHLLLFGGIKDKTLLNGINVPYTYLGRVHAEYITELLAHVDVILSTSLYESFGGTLIEGLAAGCIPVTFGNGGQEDIVDHLRTGYIAEYKSPSDIANGIEWAISSGISRESLHDEVNRKFSESSVVNRYLELIKSIT